MGGTNQLKVERRPREKKINVNCWRFIRNRHIMRYVWETLSSLDQGMKEDKHREQIAFDRKRGSEFSGLTDCLLPNVPPYLMTDPYSFFFLISAATSSF